ncbi:G5 and 3D domain-containing protein [Sporosarcina jiandibaonis]|uniref:G5 and 3D domain-containing protein n=1 Tax=Sporosarcina jiandibaonis TaxID=2715535 RepID=UPI0015562F0C|nr:G5 and 3D domain-containing protein [Sporosarcina jiandibaonis]
MLSSIMKSLFLKSLRSQQIATFIIIPAVFVTVISLALYEGNKKSVTLVVNGETEEIKTHASTVGKLLSESELVFSEHDRVSPSIESPIENGSLIKWEQAKKVAIQVDNKEDIYIWTTEKTVGNVLEEADIELSEFDKVSPSLDAQLNESSSISVEKAYDFTLIDGKDKKKYWSTSTTVADFLKSEDIQLNEFDRLEGNNKDDIIRPGSTVEIVRVEKVTDVVEESADFAVETRNDQSMLKGREKVVQEGEKGKIAREFEVVMENGKEVSRKMTSEKTLKEPVKKVVAVGTKVIVASAAPTVKSSNSKTKSSTSSSVGVSRSKSAAPSSSKEFYVSATAYTAYCNGCSGITATGINLKNNPNLKVIAVDPSVIPLGSKVWVEGYGHAIAGDTGGAIKGKKIDLHFPTKESAYKFGRKQVKIKIID